MRIISNILLCIGSQLIEIISRFKQLDQEKIIFNSHNNECYNFNSKYLYEYLIENNKKYNLFFIINDNEVRAKLKKKYGNKFLTTKSVRDLWRIAGAKLWVTSTLETPYVPLYFFKNPKRIIYHLGHGVPLKKIVLAESDISLLQIINRYFRSRLFTHVLAYSNDFRPIMESAFKNNKIEYIELGQPRNDALAYNDRRCGIITSKLPAHKYAILYAPTWRPYAVTRFFPFDNLEAEELNTYLQHNETILFLRNHPYYPAEIKNKYLEQPNIILLNTEICPEIMDTLGYFNKLITDYSSIYLDYICLDRPIGFIPYDLEQYEKHTGFTIPYKDITPGEIINSSEDFLKFIDLASDGYSEDRRRVSELLNLKLYDNCLNHAQLIEKIIRK